MQHAQRPRQPFQWDQHDVAEDEIEWRAVADSAIGDAVREDRFDRGSGTVEAGVVARDAHAGAVDVAREHTAVARPRCRDGEHAGAGADIENGTRAAPLEQSVEREEAAARRRVVAGTESECCFDLDRDAARRNTQTIVGAVHEEAPGLDRRQSGQTRRDPVALCDRAKSKAPRSIGVSKFADARAHGVLVGVMLEIDLDGPVEVIFAATAECATGSARAGFEGSDDGLARREQFRQHVAEPARRYGVCRNAGDHRVFPRRLSAHRIAA